MVDRWAVAGLFVVALLSFASFSCGRDAGTPRGVAELFLDAHYVRVDLPAAQTYTMGLAHEKVEDERRLTRGQAIDAATRMPRVHYRLVEERIRGENAMSFVYDATFQMDGADAFHRKLQLTVRRDSNVWKVTNYQEY